MFNKGSKWLLVGLLFLASVACNFGGTTPEPTSPPTEMAISATETPAPTTTSTPYPTETPTPTKEPTPAGPQDCGESLDCMIEAAKICRPASATVTTPIDLFGMIVTTTSSYQIQGYEGTDCVFYLRTDGQQLDFSDEMVQQMLDNGMTEEEIELQKEEANRQAESVVGLDGTCHFASPDDLASMLVRWQDGSFSTEDWSVADCQGAMFGQ